MNGEPTTAAVRSMTMPIFIDLSLSSDGPSVRSVGHYQSQRAKIGRIKSERTNTDVDILWRVVDAFLGELHINRVLLTCERYKADLELAIVDACHERRYLSYTLN